jgi:hypothetical protein
MAKSGLDMKLDLPSDADMKRMFDAVPILTRHKVSDQTVRAGCKPIVTKARQLAPRGDKTGTSEKRSKAQQAKANWNVPLWKTIALVVRKYSANAAGIVGPKWPDGNKAYFNTSPSGRKQVLWGKVTGVTVPQVRNWIVKAFDETKPQQLSAMKKKLTQLMDGIWKSG